VLYGGAAGGGKSFLGVFWLLYMCERYQGSRWLMGRAVAKTLKETTLNSFFDVCSMVGHKAGRDYTYNQQTGQIQVGQSTIILKDLFAYPSDPNFDDLGSLEITGAFIDEANQVTAKAKAIVGSRIRYKLDEFGLRPKLLLTCNPARNWVFTDFYEPWRKGTLEPHRAFVPALVTDNEHISAHYIDNLKRLTGPDRERLLLGNWDYDIDPARLIDHEAVADLWSNDHVPAGAKAITADVARYGSDLTVVAVWEGLRCIHLESHASTSVPQAAGRIRDLATLHHVGRSRIVVDDDGIGGGVVDLLPGCVAFKGGGRPIDRRGRNENFLNLKAQCSYMLAEVVNARGMHMVPELDRDRIAEELAWIKRDKVDSDGKLRILGKDKVKEGIGRSPDYADTLMMRMVLELKGASIFERSIDQADRRRVHEMRRNLYKELE
jgi:phage terminase large subunit